MEPTNGTNVSRFEDQNGTEEYTCDYLNNIVYGASDPFKDDRVGRTLVMTLYIFMASVGAIGNFFVIAAVVRNPQMRTPRNYFIINLALSDFLMCTITVPFTMHYTMNTYWDLGPVVCKLVGGAQGLNIFVSTMSITAIGLDRYWVILFPTKTQQQRVIIGICFTTIWFLSFLLAFPLFYAVNASVPPILLQPRVVECGIVRYMCVEEWSNMYIHKGIYSISCTVFQYVLPIAMLTFVYTRIIWRLENRMVHRQRAAISQFERSTTGGPGSMVPNGPHRRRSIEVRQRRMNLLLIFMVAFFAFCWLPLNVMNALTAFDLVKFTIVIFVSCHTFGMLSAAANPILYGVFNENFRTEFIAILTVIKIVPIVRCFASVLRSSFSRPTGNRNNRASFSDGTRVTNSSTVMNVRSRRNTWGSLMSIRIQSKPVGPGIHRRSSRKLGDVKAVSPACMVVVDQASPVNMANGSCCSPPPSPPPSYNDTPNSVLSRTPDNEDEGYYENGRQDRAFSDASLLADADADVDVDEDASAKRTDHNETIPAILEEKIPLFSNCVTNGGAQLKSYMLNTDL